MTLKDTMNKLAQQNLNNSLDTVRKMKLPGLHNRISQKQQADADAEVLAGTMANRIGLMLDTSGSMNDYGDEGFGYNRFNAGQSNRKIDLLSQAMQSFIQDCNFHDTSLAIETFPFDEKFRLPLTCFEPILTTTVISLSAGGGTPLSEAMSYVLGSYSLTRAIIVSDGEADNYEASIQQATQYREAGTPIDCVHIGMSTHGEKLLRKIAEITGGIYIKFDDVKNFAKNFSYLTPQKRAQLFLAGAQQMLGAREIK